MPFAFIYTELVRLFVFFNESQEMLKVKNTLVLAGMITAWPMLCFAGFFDANDLPGGTNESDPDIMWTMVKSLVFIIVLGGIAVYLSKKFMPKMRISSGKDINIRETIHLGPNKTMHLVEIGRKKFLVGSTSDKISMLADVTETLEAEDGNKDA